MPFFIAALWGGFASMLTSLVGRVLASLFISYVTYSGVDTALNFIKQQALNKLASVPPIAIQVFGILQIGTALNIIFSAMVAAFALQQLGGKITKMRFKAP